MKIKDILILLFSCSSSLLCQYSNQSLSDYMKTFEDAKIASETKIPEVIDEKQPVIDKLSSLDIKTLALRKHINSLPVKDFLNIIDMRTKSYEEDLYRPQELWYNYDKNISQNSETESIRFGIYEGILKNRLEELYGAPLAHLILSPLLLKVKVIDEKTESVSVSKEDWIGIKVFTAEIQEIIKGGNNFKVGQTIQFYYVPFWLQTGNRFIINEAYFLSLLPVIDNKTGVHRLALDVNEVNNGIIQISKNIIMDNNDYFGFGMIPWDSFKTKIGYYVDIKNLPGGVK